MHEVELRSPVQKYLALYTTVDGWQDPNVMAQVATGNRLDDLIRSRCVDCPGVEVATGVQIVTFQVLDYKPDTSEVFLQYEGGWQLVDPKTRSTIGQCNVGVYDIELILSREDNIWKVANVGEFISKVISNEEFVRLTQRYCRK